MEREFRSNGGEFKEYKVTNLFNYSRGTRLIKSNRQDGKYPLVTAGEFNQGIKGFIEPNTQKIYNNAITIDMFCNAFVHLDDFCCDDNILVLQSKNPINHKALFYIATVMNMDKYKFGYGKQYRMNSLEAHKIFLPTLGGEINFSFMEKFIEELERERVEELDAYLLATGLKNYKLTQSEKTALAKFDEFSRRRGVAKKFKIGDLFLVVSNPQLNKESFHFSDNGEYPYFTRTVLNNGIAGYVDYLDEKHKINGNSLAVGMLGMQFFYMKKDFYAGQFTKTIYPKFDNFNKDIAQYFICWLNKKQNFYQSHLVRDFERLFNETTILLPISEDGKINYKFIKDFIKAIEKLVIKDIVLWADKKIEATKKVVNKA
nr:restriction endonuclease subunit S [Campylobacter concisus]